jgi:hypothetical protein
MTIREHLPGYITTHEPSTATFNTAQELMEVDFVRRKADYPAFRRFSVSRDDPARLKLMLEADDGREWYVIGHLSGDVPELPDWIPVRE